MGRRGTCVWFGDVPVGLQAPDAERLAMVQRVVGRLELAEAEPAAWLRVVDAAPAVPARAPDVSEHAASLWIDGAELVVELGGSVARADATAVTIGGIDAADAGVVRRLLLPAMTHVLAASDRFVLHGAAAVAPAGGAVVIAGASGRGKSTVAFAAHAAGWAVLADDMVIVRRRAAGLEVAGVPQEFAVPAELVDGRDRDRLGLCSAPGDARGRLLVPVAPAGTSWHPVVAFARVEHGETPDGDLVPLAAADALPAVLSSFTSVLAPDRLRAFLPVAAELARLTTWKLRLGREPTRRVAGVHKALRSLG
jgi:hypothetical protein